MTIARLSTFNSTLRTQGRKAKKTREGYFGDLQFCVVVIIVVNDAQTGMPPGGPGGAMCVRGLRDSLNPAIHTTYRISLRSSSLWEPRCPPPTVVSRLDIFDFEKS